MATTRTLRAAAAPRSRRAARAAPPPRAVFGGDKGADAPAVIKRWPEEVAPAGVRLLCGGASSRAAPQNAAVAALNARIRSQVALPPVKPTKKLPLFGARRAPAPAAPLTPRATAEAHMLRRCAFLLSGFVDQAETINSRAAMIGFFALLLVEAVRRGALSRNARLARGSASRFRGLTRAARPPLQVAGKGLLDLVGIETGNGIDIGF